MDHKMAVDDEIPEATECVIDTTTMTGKLATGAIDLVQLYHSVDLARFPMLYSIGIAAHPTRSLYQQPEPAKDRKWFRHQCTLVVLVDSMFINVKLFRNGSVNIVGCVTEQQGRAALDYVTQILAGGVPPPGAPLTVLTDAPPPAEAPRSLLQLGQLAEPLGIPQGGSGGETPPVHVRVTNIHCVFSCNFHIDRYRLFYLAHRDLSAEFSVTFDPQRFPGVKMKSITAQRGTAFLFQRGKIVLTGVQSSDAMQSMRRRILAFLHAHYAEVGGSASNKARTDP